MSTATGTAVVVTPEQAAARAMWVLTDRGMIYTTSKETGGQYAVVESIVQPGGGPPPHLHHREDELFYILEGTFSMVLGAESFTAHAGESLFLPRGVIHTFKNIGDAPGRLLTVAIPAGFDAFFAEIGEPCDDPTQVPAITPQRIEKLQATCAKHGLELIPAWHPTRTASPKPAPRQLWVLGLHVKLLTRGSETKNSFSVAQITAAPGNFVPPHRHEREDELFYVVEGTMEFEIEGRTITAAHG